MWLQEGPRLALVLGFNKRSSSLGRFAAIWRRKPSSFKVRRPLPGSPVGDCDDGDA